MLQCEISGNGIVSVKSLLGSEHQRRRKELCVIPLAFIAAVPGFFWHAIPLIAVISLVYGATRHELMGPIVRHAYHTAIWIFGFIAFIFAILWLVSWMI
jgi:hypothetical protein